MSLGSPKLARREQAIEATRRRLRRLEIETHRIKAELARLEAEYEDDVADRLSRNLRRRTPLAVEQRVDEPHGATSLFESGATIAPRVLPFAAPSRTEATQPGIPLARVSDPGYKPNASKAAPPRPNDLPVPQIVADTNPQGMTARSANRPRRVATLRTAASPLMFSLAVHAVALLLCVSFTFATLVQQGIPLFSSPSDVLDDAPVEISEVEITANKFDDTELQNTIIDSEQFNIADNMLRELEPAQLGAGSHPLGDIGQLDALPSELGTLMAGAGAPGSGQPGGPLGEAVFFGARSKGDRFVFVVDNSSSMKGGRLEAAIAELLKTTDALSPRQSFYVIFVSDQTYPMFYPVTAPDLVPATAPNKKRLADWLPNAILASGNNRQLIKAMDMAASLRPHAVFLLWDGDMKYSDKVRLEVMTHLTRPNSTWDFAIHTLGMGVTSLDAEQNLTTIAQAHGGTFRRVDVPTVRGR